MKTSNVVAHYFSYICSCRQYHHKALYVTTCHQPETIFCPLLINQHRQKYYGFVFAISSIFPFPERIF